MKKTVFTLLLTLICILSLALCVSAEENAIGNESAMCEIILGDVDGDGQVTNADVLMIYRYIYNSELYPLPTTCSHSYGNWTEIEPTTCTDDGKMARVCAKCLSVEETTVEGGHIYGIDLICKRCGYSDTYDIVFSEGLAFTTNKNGTCYVSGIGTCTDTDLVIPTTSPDGDKVTGIGASAFKGNTTLTSVKLPATMQTVNNNAFSGCTQLSKIVLNEGLTTIQYNAFASTAITELVIPDTVASISNNNTTGSNYSIVEGCQKLRKVYIGSGVTTLPAYIFQGLTALEEVVIGENVKTVDKHAFSDCTALTAIVIPNNVTELMGYTFSGCVNLKNITWSNTLNTIGESAFEGCTSLTSVKLPASVKTIKYSAFKGCSMLETLMLNEGLTTIGYNAFANTIITELVIPNTVASISNYDTTGSNHSIVEGCQKLRKVYIGSGVTKIPAYMFQGLTALEEVVIGENVKTVDNYAFSGCTALTYIVIPNNVTELKGYAFSGCVNLKNITWSSALNTIGYNAFEGCTSLTSVKLPPSVKTINNSAFKGCSMLETLVLNEGLTTIDYNAFANTIITELVIPDTVALIGNYGSTGGNYSIVEGCQKLRKVYIGSGVTTLPAYIFQGLTALEEVVIGENVKTVDYHAFSGCTALTYIVIPNNVTELRGYAFSGCVNLKNITWSSALNTIGYNAFEGCTSLTSVKLPASVKTIKESAFKGCSMLETLVLNEGLTTIDYNAFANTIITELVIPDTVASIGNYGSTGSNYSIVENCQKLKKVVVGKGVTKIPAYMFQGLTALEEVVIGENVKTVDNNAFSGCTALTYIVIPNNVTELKNYAFYNSGLKNIIWSNALNTIGVSAFEGCTSLTSVKLPASVKTIKDSAFKGCSMLETLVLNEGLTTIDFNAFANTIITELVIPDTVASISNYGSTSNNYSIVEGCQKLRKVYIGSGLTKIPAYMFQGLTALEEVVIGENVKTIDNNAFSGCTALTAIVIPDNVTELKSYVFYNSGLKNITIPASVHTIGDYAFSSCAKLEYLLIEGTALKKIGKNVTSDCPSARRIYYKGTVTDWNSVSINTSNVAPFNKIPYIYSSYNPAQEGNYWHYSASGTPVVWDITLSEYKVYALANAYTGTMGSPLLSCSTNYIKVMEDDSAFMTQKALYETATLISDLGSALENQMNKEQLYMIVLLDVLGYNYAGKSETPELVDNILTYGSFVEDTVGLVGDVITKEALTEVFPMTDLMHSSVDLIVATANTARDEKIALQYLMGFAMQCQNSIDILTRISNDTSNDKNLRSAANKVIEIIESAFDGTLEKLIHDDMNIQYASNFAAVAIDTIWGIGCNLYLPAKIATWVAEGVKITLDLFCDTGVSVDAYYKLRVTSIIENALRNQINSLSGDYLRRENLKQSSLIYAVIDLYRSAITKGYEYTLDYLDSVDKDSDYIRESYNHNTEAFKQYELEVEYEYYNLY